MANDRRKSSEVILKVENLKQYFHVNRTDLKAVDGVSFEVYKG